MKGKIRAILFVIVLFSLSLINILTPTVYFSNREGRYLQTLPKINYGEIISGKFGKDFEKFTTDQFAGRNFWISTKTLSDLTLLKKDNGRVYFARDNYLIDIDSPIDEEQLEKNIENVSTFIRKAKKLGDIDINILLVPSKSQAEKNKLPKYAPRIDERSLVGKIRNSLGKESRVFDLMDILEEKSDDYIYYRTDHHWTSKGAYYGYNYFLKELGLESLKEDDFIITRVSDNFLGTSYRKANLYFGSADEIHKYSGKNELQYRLLINGEIESKDIYAEDYLEKMDKYSYFFGGDKAIIEIDTSVNNGKSIMIFKDSFANSFIPFLMNHFEKLIVVDTRYYNISLVNLLEEKPVNQVLFLYNIQNFAREKSFNVFKR